MISDVKVKVNDVIVGVSELIATSWVGVSDVTVEEEGSHLRVGVSDVTVEEEGGWCK